jgi:hypothetical protein
MLSGGNGRAEAGDGRARRMRRRLWAAVRRRSCPRMAHSAVAIADMNVKGSGAAPMPVNGGPPPAVRREREGVEPHPVASWRAATTAGAYGIIGTSATPRGPQGRRSGSSTMTEMTLRGMSRIPGMR